MKKLLGFCLLITLAGCGEPEGPKRYEFSGAVTYDGNPAPAGSIIFTPDDSQGNNGPQGTAAIKDGKYDTASQGRGIVGGPHKVRIVVTEAGASAEDAEISGPLANYETTVDFPEENGTHDFEFETDEPAEE